MIISFAYFLSRSFNNCTNHRRQFFTVSCGLTGCVLQLKFLRLKATAGIDRNFNPIYIGGHLKNTLPRNSHELPIWHK